MLVILAFVAVALAVDAIEGRDSRLFLGLLAAVAVARAGVSLTWRDSPVVGPLNAGTLIALGVAIGCVVGWLVVDRRRATSPADEARRVVDWADPEVRPRF